MPLLWDGLLCGLRAWRWGPQNLITTPGSTKAQVLRTGSRHPRPARHPW